MTKRIALFPGSFDPFTRGHESVVRRALDLFDEIIIAIGVNSSKKYLFDLDQRVSMIESVFADAPSVRVESYKGLTIDFAIREGARYLLRGLRNSRDFEYEAEIARMNLMMEAGIETVFLISLPEYSAINSTIIREIYKNKGDISTFVPEGMNMPS